MVDNKIVQSTMKTVDNNNLTLLPPAVITPEKSNKNPNIKERLNLHVKRRLQETTDLSGSGGSVLSPPISVSGRVPISPNSINSNIGLKRSDKSNTSTTMHQGGGRGGKRAKNKNQLCTSNSLNSSVDDDCSREANSNNNNNSSDSNTNTSTAITSPHTKDKDTGPDLLTWILNEKKLSVMRDPEVIKFLENVIGALRK